MILLTMTTELCVRFKNKYRKYDSVEMDTTQVIYIF